MRSWDSLGWPPYNACCMTYLKYLLCKIGITKNQENILSPFYIAPVIYYS